MADITPRERRGGEGRSRSDGESSNAELHCLGLGAYLGCLTVKSGHREHRTIFLVCEGES